MKIQFIYYKKVLLFISSFLFFVYSFNGKVRAQEVLSNTKFNDFFNYEGFTKLQTPADIYVLSTTTVRIDLRGYIYIVDSKGYCIHIFSDKGQWIRSFGQRGQGPKEFKSPKNLVLTPDGKILVADAGNQRLSVWDTTGNFIKIIPLKRAPQELFLIGDNRIATMSFGQGLFYFYDYEGNYLFNIGKWRDLQEQFLQKYRIPIHGGSSSVDNYGNFYFAFVGKYLIRKYDSSGKLLLEFGRKAPFYREPPEPPAEISPKSIQKWQESWTPVFKVLATQEDLILVQIRTYKKDSQAYDSMIDIYDLNGKLITGSLQTIFRLETQSPDGFLYFIELPVPENGLEIENPNLHKFKIRKLPDE